MGYIASYTLWIFLRKVNHPRENYNCKFYLICQKQGNQSMKISINRVLNCMLRRYVIHVLHNRKIFAGGLTTCGRHYYNVRCGIFPGGKSPVRITLL